MRGVSRLLLPPYKSLRILLSPASVRGTKVQDTSEVVTMIEPVLTKRLHTSCDLDSPHQPVPSSRSTTNEQTSVSTGKERSTAVAPDRSIEISLRLEKEHQKDLTTLAARSQQLTTSYPLATRWRTRYHGDVQSGEDQYKEQQSIECRHDGGDHEYLRELLRPRLRPERLA